MNVVVVREKVNCEWRPFYTAEFGRVTLAGAIDGSLRSTSTKFVRMYLTLKLHEAKVNVKRQVALTQPALTRNLRQVETTKRNIHVRRGHLISIRVNTGEVASEDGFHRGRSSKLQACADCGAKLLLPGYGTEYDMHDLESSDVESLYQ